MTRIDREWPRRRLLGAFLFVFVAVTATALAESLPAEIDRCPYTGRFPVEIRLDAPVELHPLTSGKIDIDRIDGRTVTAYVNDAQLADLRAGGYAIEPIPNQARRAWARERATGREDYHTYETLTAELQQIAADHPDITQLITLGLSVEGREIWALKLSDNAAIDEPEPEVKYSATMHGDEPVGTELCVYLIRLLVENYGIDPDLTAMVDDLEIWIIPLHNPDGNASGTRYNAQGIDLNRGFPDPAEEPDDDPTGRAYEVQRMMYFQDDHRFVIGANLHTGALVVNYPWDCFDGQYTPDDAMYLNISLGYSALNLPMYNSTQFDRGVTIGWDWYVTQGSIQDWSYYWRNEIHVTIEQCSTKWPPSSWLPSLWDDNREAMLYYLQQGRIGVEGFVTDATDGSPIEATVDVVEIGKAIEGDPEHGFYHRMLEPGSYTLEFSAFGYQPRTENGVSVSAGTTTQLDVQLQRETWYDVSGTITDADTGLPVGAEIFAVRQDSGEIIRTTSSAPPSGDYSFTIPSWQYDIVVSVPGYVTVTETRLVNGDTVVDFVLTPARGELLVVNDGSATDDLATGAAALEYRVIEQTVATTDPSAWGDYDLVVWNAGSYKSPASIRSLRDALEAHVAGGGKLLVEGGEIGYDAAVTPGYPSFAANVLHISDWDADNAGDLELIPAQASHPLATTPNALPSTLGIDYDYYGDEDAVVPQPDATAIFGTASYPSDPGVLVVEAPGGGGQIVYFAFDYSALSNGAAARDLLENALDYLMGDAQGVAEDGATPSLRLSRPRPSPARGTVRLSLELPVAGRTQVAVYDLTGRAVRTLIDAPLAAGRHTLVWDGRDAAGHPASQGVYFVRVTTPAGERVQRLMQVR